jgi:hypothetical protein
MVENKVYKNPPSKEVTLQNTKVVGGETFIMRHTRFSGFQKVKSLA